MHVPHIGAVTRAQDVLLAPSAFMPTTGKAHWEVGRAYTSRALRARAGVHVTRTKS